MLYQSGVTLPPGRFGAKVVVRENTNGLVGSFEAPLIVPELKAADMKVSSVVLSIRSPVASCQLPVAGCQEAEVRCPRPEGRGHRSLTAYLTGSS
ncbi:hypothetical protein BH24ACI4_BH24ACI4_17230 [soil metagenome]